MKQINSPAGQSGAGRNRDMGEVVSCSNYTPDNQLLFKKVGYRLVVDIETTLGRRMTLNEADQVKALIKRHLPENRFFGVGPYMCLRVNRSNTVGLENFKIDLLKVLGVF